MEVRTCTVCSSENTRKISALGHDDKLQYGQNGHWNKCTRCGNESGSAEHSYGSWWTETSAGCTTEGRDLRMCTVCGYEDSRTVSALGHAYELYHSTERGHNGHWMECPGCGDSYGFQEHYGDWKTETEATCVKDGKKARICDLCGERNTKTIDATGQHDYVLSTGPEGTWKECTMCHDKTDFVPAANSSNRWTECSVDMQLLSGTEGADWKVETQTGYAFKTVYP